MTNVDKAIELLESKCRECGMGHHHCKGVDCELRAVIAILREKTEPTELSRKLRQSAGFAAGQHRFADSEQMVGAADLLDQQARHIAITDEALKVKESLNEVLRAEIDKLKKERR